MPNFGAPLVVIGTWTTIGSNTRYPSSGTLNFSSYAFLSGVIGLNPSGPTGGGALIVDWTSDAGGSNIVGVQGISLTSNIVSLAQLRLPNLGPYGYLTYKPQTGTSQVAATFFGIDGVSPTMLEYPPDTILITEASQSLAANTSVSIYPDDYFAGEVRVYFTAPSGVTWTLYGVDLTAQTWVVDTNSSGNFTTLVPMGVWFMTISNTTNGNISWGMTVTPRIE